jgi:hypothetical protein
MWQVVRALVVIMVINASEALTPSAAADIIPISLATGLDMESGQITFSVVFDQTPDFYTTDNDGRPADNFQFYVDSVGPSNYFEFYQSTVGEAPHKGKSLIRGETIPEDAQLRIVWLVPDSDSGMNGGWGTTAAIVPFSLVGPELTFALSISDLQDDDGLFWYYLDTFAYGETAFVSSPDSLNTPFVSGRRYFLSESDVSVAMFIAFGLVLVFGARKRHPL